jgi:hypothetical protein
MSFKRAVPKDVGELKENFHNLVKNRSHVKKIEVNLTSGHLEVTLDWLARAKVGDFYLPLVRAKINEAKELVEKMLRGMDGGTEPSDAQIQELFDLIDPAGQ